MHNDLKWINWPGVAVAPFFSPCKQLSLKCNAATFLSLVYFSSGDLIIHLFQSRRARAHVCVCVCACVCVLIGKWRWADAPPTMAGLCAETERERERERVDYGVDCGVDSLNRFRVSAGWRFTEPCGFGGFVAEFRHHSSLLNHWWSGLWRNETKTKRHKQNGVVIQFHSLIFVEFFFFFFFVFIFLLLLLLLLICWFGRFKLTDWNVYGVLNDVNWWLALIWDGIDIFCCLVAGSEQDWLHSDVSDDCDDVWLNWKQHWRREITNRSPIKYNQ